MLALAPFKFQKGFLNLLKLFVNFSETDVLAKLINHGKYVYTDEYLLKKWFIPKNYVFNFISVYPRIKGLKILFRIFINLIFFFFYKKLKNIIQEKEKLIKEVRKVLQNKNTNPNRKICLASKRSERIKSNDLKASSSSSSLSKNLVLLVKYTKQFKRYSFLMKYLLRLIMSLDYINIVSNILLISTSLRKGISSFDFFVIFIDLYNLVYFQEKLVALYFKYKGKSTSSIKDVSERELIVDLAYY